MELFQGDLLVTFIRLLAAMGLGLLLGLERIYAHKSAGLRTYALVSMASALFIVISEQVAMQYVGTPGFTFDPLRVAAQIVVGVGFLGTGLIIFNNNQVHNLTTASGLWMCAAIGMACGFGLYMEAVFGTLLAFFVLGVLSSVERRFRIKFFGTHPDEEENSKS